MSRVAWRIQQGCVGSGWTLAVAESCTGGLITHQLTNVPGSSRYVLLAVVAYHDAAKVHLLRVPQRLLRRHGAVSASVVRRMAQGVWRVAGATFGLAVTGIAGPMGGTPRKPVGTVYIAIASARRTWTFYHHFRGSRLQIKRQAAETALRHLFICVQRQALARPGRAGGVRSP